MSETPMFAVLLTILYIINDFGNGFNHFTVTSRIGYALARDNAFPGSTFLKKVNSTTNNPDNVSIAIFVFEALLCVVPLFSIVAYNDITLLIAVGIAIGWTAPTALRFYQQLKGKDHKRGKFSLGKYSSLVGFISLVWLVPTLFALFLPTTSDTVLGITWSNFNFASVVTLVWWAIIALNWWLP